MSVKFIVVILSVCLCGVSCSKVSETVSSEKVSSGSDLKDKYAGGFSYGTSGGAVQSQSDKKSVYAEKDFGGTNDFSSKSYGTKGYDNKRWGGDTKFAKKQYGGGKSGEDFKHAPAFVKEQARYGGLEAAGLGKNFETERLSKSEAREVSRGLLDKTSSWYAKRDNFEKPIIIQQSDQTGLSIRKAREMLGRKDTE